MAPSVNLSTNDRARLARALVCSQACRLAALWTRHRLGGSPRSTSPGNAVRASQSGGGQVRAIPGRAGVGILATGPKLQRALVDSVVAIVPVYESHVCPCLCSTLTLFGRLVCTLAHTVPEGRGASRPVVPGGPQCLGAYWDQEAGVAVGETQTFRIKDYELTCSAQACDNGRFEPALVISRQVWPSRPRTIAVRRGAHPTPEIAIESARAQGVEWIANFG